MTAICAESAQRGKKIKVRRVAARLKPCPDATDATAIAENPHPSQKHPERKRRASQPPLTSQNSQTGWVPARANAKASRQPAQVRRWRDVSYKQAQFQRVSELHRSQRRPTKKGPGFGEEKPSRLLVAWLLEMTNASRWAGKVGADACWQKQSGVKTRSFAALRMTHEPQRCVETGNRQGRK